MKKYLRKALCIALMLAMITGIVGVSTVQEAEAATSSISVVSMKYSSSTHKDTIKIKCSKISGTTYYRFRYRVSKTGSSSGSYGSWTYVVTKSQYITFTCKSGYYVQVQVQRYKPSQKSWSSKKLIYAE